MTLRLQTASTRSSYRPVLKPTKHDARTSILKRNSCFMMMVGAIVAMWANYILAHSKKLAHGPDVAANWQNDGNKMSERWWFS